jgi:hypothetical protein
MRKVFSLFDRERERKECQTLANFLNIASSFIVSFLNSWAAISFSKVVDSNPSLATSLEEGTKIIERHSCRQNHAYKKSIKFG